MQNTLEALEENLLKLVPYGLELYDIKLEMVTHPGSDVMHGIKNLEACADSSLRHTRQLKRKDPGSVRELITFSELSKQREAGRVCAKCWHYAQVLQKTPSGKYERYSRALTAARSLLWLTESPSPRTLTDAELGFAYLSLTSAERTFQDSRFYSLETFTGSALAEYKAAFFETTQDLARQERQLRAMAAYWARRDRRDPLIMALKQLPRFLEQLDGVFGKELEGLLLSEEFSRIRVIGRYGLLSEVFDDLRDNATAALLFLNDSEELQQLPLLVFLSYFHVWLNLPEEILARFALSAEEVTGVTLETFETFLTDHVGRPVDAAELLSTARLL